MSFEKIKELITNLKQIRQQSKYLKRIKKSIKLLNKEIIIENIDVSLLKEKNKLNEYLNQLFKNYPSFNITFSNCNIEEINLVVRHSQQLNFRECEIKGLEIHSNNKNSVNFNKCKFNFFSDESKQLVRISTYKVNLCDCTVDIKSNKQHIFEIGKDKESTVNIRNQRFLNKDNIPFILQINSSDLTLNNYKNSDNIELIINKGIKDINYIHLVNSNVNFSHIHKVIVNMLLIENSSIMNLIAESKSIELSGNCFFDKVKILKSHDFTINEDTSLTTKDIILNAKYLECLENSQINDINNRYTWLSNVSKIATHKDFKLKYNGKVIHNQEQYYIDSSFEIEDTNVNINQIKNRR